MHSDQARVSNFAQRSRDARILCEGTDSSEAADLEKLVSKPSSFENFGVTKNWKSTLGEVPKDAGDADFEQWLWRAQN